MGFKSFALKLSRRTVANQLAKYALKNLSGYSEKLADRLDLGEYLDSADKRELFESFGELTLGLVVDVLEDKAGVVTSIDISKRDAVLAIFDLAHDNLHEAREAGDLDFAAVPNFLEDAAFGWLEAALAPGLEADSVTGGVLYQWARSTALLD